MVDHPDPPDDSTVDANDYGSSVQGAWGERAAPPILQRPTYVEIASPAHAGPALKAAAGDACRVCKDVATSPNAGLIGATLLGVTAAYFAPKFFDWLVPRLQGREEPEEYDLDFEPEEER